MRIDKELLSKTIDCIENLLEYLRDEGVPTTEEYKYFWQDIEDAEKLSELLYELYKKQTNEVE